MKLYMKDGRLRFDYEYQSDIKRLYENGGDYDFMNMISSRRQYPFPHKTRWWEYPHEDIYSQLERHIEHCKKIGVTITSEAQAYIDDLKAKAEADTARREADEARQKALYESAKAKREWQRRCTNGCRGCANLRYDAGMPWCKATHHILEDKNIADMKKADSYDDEGVFHLFNFEPFPDEGCPLRTEPMTEEEKEVYTENERYYA